MAPPLLPNPYAPPQTEVPAQVPELVAMTDKVLIDLWSDSWSMYRFGIFNYCCSAFCILIPVVAQIDNLTLHPNRKLPPWWMGLIVISFAVLLLYVGQGYVRRPAWGRSVVLTISWGWWGYGRWFGLEYGRRSWELGFDRLFDPNKLRHGDIDLECRRRHAANPPT